jgi:hypothetical protein
VGSRSSPACATSSLEVDEETGALITDAAREQQADLIVMATHGRGGLARVVLGSVATGILQRTSVPLVLVRPSAMRQQTTARLPEPAAEPIRAAPAPEPAPTERRITLRLTPRELDLIERGLGELIYLPESDRELARPARELLAHLKRQATASTTSDSRA